MKTSSSLVFAAALAASACPAAAQMASPPSRQVTPSPNNSDVVPDGVTFYRGQTYLLRNGRAALVDATLVPPDKVLTRTGGLVPIPPELVGALPPPNRITPSLNSDIMQNGIVHWSGKSYLIRGGMLLPIDSRIAPEGHVYTVRGNLAALPSDFSGFVHDPARAGNTGSALVSDGTQALSRQAGVPQMVSGPQEPRITLPQANVAGPGSSGFVRTGVLTSADGTTTPIGITPNGAAVPLNSAGTVTSPGANAGMSAASPIAASADTRIPAGNLGATVGSRYVPPSVNSVPAAAGVNVPGVAANSRASARASSTAGVNRRGNGASTTGQATGTVSGSATTPLPSSLPSMGDQPNPLLPAPDSASAQTGTFSTQSPAPATQTGSVSTQSTPPATQTGTVSTQGTPTATQTGTISTQSTPTATTGTTGTQTMLPGNQNTTNPNSVPGNTGIEGGTTSATTGTTGTAGTATGTSSAGTFGGTGTSGGTSSGATSGGTSGGATSGGTSGGGTSGGTSGGGTSGGTSGGGTSGGGGAGGL